MSGGKRNRNKNQITSKKLNPVRIKSVISQRVAWIKTIALRVFKANLRSISTVQIFYGLAMCILAFAFYLDKTKPRTLMPY